MSRSKEPPLINLLDMSSKRDSLVFSFRGDNLYEQLNQAELHKIFHANSLFYSCMIVQHNDYNRMGSILLPKGVSKSFEKLDIHFHPLKDRLGFTFDAYKRCQFPTFYGEHDTAWHKGCGVPLLVLLEERRQAKKDQMPIEFQTKPLRSELPPEKYMPGGLRAFNKATFGKPFQAKHQDNPGALFSSNFTSTKIQKEGRAVACDDNGDVEIPRTENESQKNLKDDFLDNIQFDCSSNSPLFHDVPRQSGLAETLTFGKKIKLTLNEKDFTDEEWINYVCSYFKNELSEMQREELLEKTFHAITVEEAQPNKTILELIANYLMKCIVKEL